MASIEHVVSLLNKNLLLKKYLETHLQFISWWLKNYCYESVLEGENERERDKGKK